MPDEIELKLALPESEQRRFLRHGLLKQALSRETVQLVNIYYDTPDLALHKRGIAMRLRRQGRLWLQTIKCAGVSAAGLSRRPEWETPYRGQFDFSAISDEPLRKWLTRPKISGRVGPVFETSFRRTTWRFEPETGRTMLLMLDRGWISAAGKRERISEVEIELVTGDVASLFQLAQSLSATLPLTPAMRSKAERGYRLFGAIEETPVKARNIPLQANMAPMMAFQRIALSCLEHLQTNHHGAVSGGDPEYIHQMRVATRRLRAAMRLFRAVLPPGFSEELLPSLRELMLPLGQTRDLDVLLTEIVAPVMSALPTEPRLAALAGHVTERHHAARTAAIHVLQAPEYGRLMLLATHMLHQPIFTSTNESINTPLTRFATSRLKQLRHKILRLAAESRSNDPASLHALRIGIKRLRYALEFFSPLMAEKNLRAVLRHLVNLQDSLGQLNDLANAGDLLMQCAADIPHLREAVSLIGGWHGPRHKELLTIAAKAIARLRHIPLPPLPK